MLPIGAGDKKQNNGRGGQEYSGSKVGFQKHQAASERDAETRYQQAMTEIAHFLLESSAICGEAQEQSELGQF